MNHKIYIREFKGKNVFNEIFNSYSNMKTDILQIGHKMNLDENFPVKEPYRCMYLSHFILADYVPLVGVSVQAMISENNDYGRIIFNIRHKFYNKDDDKYRSLESVVDELAKKYELEDMNKEK